MSSFVKVEKNILLDVLKMEKKEEIEVEFPNLPPVRFRNHETITTEESTYYVPFDKNEKSIDSVLTPNSIFQFTISTRHDIIAPGLS